MSHAPIKIQLTINWLWIGKHSEASKYLLWVFFSPSQRAEYGGSLSNLWLRLVSHVVCVTRTTSPPRCLHVSVVHAVTIVKYHTFAKEPPPAPVFEVYVPHFKTTGLPVSIVENGVKIGRRHRKNKILNNSFSMWVGGRCWIHSYSLQLLPYRFPRGKM